MRHVVRYLKKIERDRPHLGSWMRKFVSLYRKKKWEKLELKIMQFIEEVDGRFRFELYEKFISAFELNVNPLWLIEYSSRIAELWTSPEAIISMIKTNFKPKVSGNKLASIYCRLLIGEQFLKLGDRKAVQRILDRCQVDYSSDHDIVNLRHFKLSMRHYRLLGNQQKKLEELEKNYMASKSPIEYRSQMQHYEFIELIEDLYRTPRWSLNA